MKAEQVEKAAAVLNALDNPIRRQMVDILIKNDTRPSILRKQIKMSRARIDYHIGFLFKTKVVYRRKGRGTEQKGGGQISFYCINQQQMRRIEKAVEWLTKE